MTSIETYPIETSLDDVGAGGRIGLIALATDFNSEQDLRRILPDDVEIFTHRVLNANPVTIQNLKNMAADISRAAAGILPGERLDAMIYGCTSGAVVNGAERIEELIHERCPGIPVTNPATAALAAFEHFGVSKISILTPYTDTVNRKMLSFFEDAGIDVVNIIGLGFESDSEMTGIPPSEISRIAAQVVAAEADLLFISCTAIRAAGVIEDIEQLILKPVVTSNQALIWHSLALIDYAKPIVGFGSLFRQQT